MMLYLYVQQHQWIVLALLSGAALMLLFCLTYQAMWLPRDLEQKGQGVEINDTRSFFGWLRSFLPWVLILLILTSVLFTVATMLAKTCRPPNW